MKYKLWLFRLLIIVAIFGACSISGHSQSSAIKESKNEKIFQLIAKENVIPSRFNKVIEKEEVICFIASTDSTRVFIIQGKIVEDPFLHIKEDPLNKVNLITHGDIQNERTNKFKISTRIGAFYHNNWYWDEIDATYFEIENRESSIQQYLLKLNNWCYFNDESTEPSILFWETCLFDEVTDLTAHPEWEAYGKNVWARKEIASRPFIGFPKFLMKTILLTEEKK